MLRDKYEKLHRDMWHYMAQRTRETKLKADKDSYLLYTRTKE